MANLKLTLGDFDAIDYHLIAIHTFLEDYRLAYFINQKLSINLSKNDTDIQIKIKEDEAHFSRFSYEGSENKNTWDLIQNKNGVLHENEKSKTHNLFSDVTMQVLIKVFLLPEFKKVDYFFKIENTDETLNLDKIKTLLNTINNVSAVYSVETTKIKSKNNLIF